MEAAQLTTDFIWGIADDVTGEIDVCEAVARLPEEPTEDDSAEPLDALEEADEEWAPDGESLEEAED